jgi:hypothetical protein
MNFSEENWKVLCRHITNIVYLWLMLLGVMALITLSCLSVYLLYFRV